MKKIIFFLGACTILCACPSVLWASSENTLTYRLYEREGDEKPIAEAVVTITAQNDGLTSVIRQKQSEHCLVTDEMVSDEEGALVRWRRTCPEDDTDIIGETNGGNLVIKGKQGGKSVDKTIDLEGKAIHIYPQFTLSPFALSDKQDMKIWSLRRDQLDKLPMQVIKKGEGTVTVNGKGIEAIKVYYSITGKLRERHFNHNYYYRKSDGVLVKKIEQNGRVEYLEKEE